MSCGSMHVCVYVHTDLHVRCILFPTHTDNHRSSVGAKPMCHPGQSLESHWDPLSSQHGGEQELKGGVVVEIPLSNCT